MTSHSVDQIPQNFDPKAIADNMSGPERDRAVRKVREWIETLTGQHDVPARGIIFDRFTGMPKVRRDMAIRVHNDRAQCLFIYIESCARGARW